MQYIVHNTYICTYRSLHNVHFSVIEAMLEQHRVVQHWCLSKRFLAGSDQLGIPCNWWHFLRKFQPGFHRCNGDKVELLFHEHPSKSQPAENHKWELIFMGLSFV